jgi:cytochrome c553
MRRMFAVSIAAVHLAGCQGMSRADSPAPGNETPAAAPPATPVAGDAARGAARSAELYCDACHGLNGSSVTTEWPSLAGQNAAYLVNQMEMLRSGARPSPEMQPIAVALADADIADLAAHYAAQAQTTRGTANNETEAGELLYRNGDRARAIRACSSCHGADGRGNSATGAPAVRGQQPGYSVRQLEAYASHARYAPGPEAARGADLQTMYASAQKLTPEEIRSLAAYLHAMP